jgi:hypothetical protein
MTKPINIRVIAAVLDTQHLLLYKEDGSTISIPQGDIRLQKILDTVVPQINRQGWAEFKEEHLNSYAGFEKKTGIKLFRVLKETVKSLFSTDEERAHVDTTKPITVGKVPVRADAQASAISQVQSIVQAEPKEKPQRRVPTLGEGLLTNAQPVKEDDHPLQHNETIVAVVGDNVIPGVEMLKGQMDHIQRGNSTVGMTKLLERLGKMIGQRGHSVEDILRFLERGDLPVADDGSIIAYKVLKTYGNSREFDRRGGLFFDCHTGQVPQQVGSVVRVDETLVDKNRRNECSNGLHIARRGYIGNFSGDVLVLCKIEPEDIITVPHNDPNKVRVCAYHIIAQISHEDHQKLRANRPMTDNEEAQILLAKAIAGDHIGKIEEVRITKQGGQGIQTKQLIPLDDFNYIADKETVKALPAVVPASIKEEAPSTLPKAKAQAKATALVIDDPKTGPKVDPKAVAIKQAAVKAKATKKKPATKPTTAAVAAPKKAPVSTPPEASKAAPKPSGRSGVAQDLYAKMNDTSAPLDGRKFSARNLLSLKRAASVSWIALGFKPGVDVPAQIETVINLPETAKAPAKAKSPVKAAKPKTNAPAAVPAVKSVKAPAKPVKAAVSAAVLSEADVLRQVKAGTLTKVEAARKLGTSPRSIARKLAKLS